MVVSVLLGGGGDWFNLVSLTKNRHLVPQPAVALPFSACGGDGSCCQWRRSGGSSQVVGHRHA